MVKPKHSARHRRRAFALANGDVSSHIAVGISMTGPDGVGAEISAPRTASVKVTGRTT